jgi:O-antigen/teichoic acid export membrane protein
MLSLSCIEMILKFIQNKNTERLIHVFTNAVSMFLPSITNIIISTIIIRFYFPEWWAQITVLQLYMFLGNYLCAWGNREVLIREFSNQPAKITQLWMESFSGRMLLLVPILVGAFIVPVTFIESSLLVLWIVLKYFTQSFEAPIIYFRSFVFNIVTELISLFVTLISIYLFNQTLSYVNVLLAISLGYFIKPLILIFKFKFLFSFRYSIHFDYKNLSRTFPFMMIGFVGILQQKIDMVSVLWLLPKIEIAKYQIFNSLLLFIHGIPGFILVPFMKSAYRLPQSSHKKIQSLLSLFGIFISSTGILLVYTLVKYLYHFDLAVSIYFLGFLFLLITYFYTFKIFLFFKENKQKSAMIINFITVGINFILCYFFIEHWNIEGAVLANVITQMIILVIYHYPISKFAKLIKWI